MVKFYKRDNETTLEDYQNACFEVFKQLVQFLNDHEIQYWLDGGTILGLVRHGDFIPWDDDIDIAMDQANYDKFRKLAKQSLPDGLSFIDESTGYMQKGFCKIYGTSFEMVNSVRNYEKLVYGIYVDIFVMEPYPKLPQAIKKPFLRIVQRVSAVTQTGRYQPTIINILKMMIYLCSNAVIRLVWKILPQGSDVANPRGLNVYFMTHDKKNIFPLQQSTWRGIDVSVPRNSDGYIRELYGNNYMQIPPKNKQITHSEKILKNS